MSWSANQRIWEIASRYYCAKLSSVCNNLSQKAVALLTAAAAFLELERGGPQLSADELAVHLGYLYNDLILCILIRQYE